MSLGGHLREFRNRAIVSALAIVLCSIVGWVYYDALFTYLNQPMIDYARNHGIDVNDVRVNFNGIANALTMKFKVALWVGFILAAPVWLWEIWAFLVPGLTPKEKKIARTFTLSAIVLFAAGVYMGTLVFPSTIDIFLGATPHGAVNLPQAGEYFSFVSRLIVSFGLAFLLPVALLSLNAMRILPAHVMIKGWRIAIILILTFTAAMTPTPDALTMFAMAAPLLVLYYGSVGVAYLMDKRRARKDVTERPDWMKVDDNAASPL